MKFNLCFRRSFRAVLCGCVNCLFFALLLAGCATDNRQPVAESGSGAREYHRATVKARDALNASISTLDTMSRPGGVNARTVENFDDAYYQLEVASVSVRSKTEAIMARGDKYFDE